MKLSVLIIDDNPADARFLSRLLRALPDWNIGTEFCEDPERLDTYFAGSRPDVVFVDYLLGAVTGIELIEKYRSSGIKSGFIIQTGHGDETVAAEALRVGAYDYLIKDGLSPEALDRSLRYVTQRLEIEAELERHRDHLDALVEEKTAEASRLSEALEQSPNSVQIADKEGDVVYVNRRFLEVSGLTRDQAIGKSLKALDFGFLTEDDFASLWAAVTAGQVWRGEFCNERNQHGKIWERAAVAPVRDDDGVITHYVAIAEDITEERRLREQLHERSIMLAEALEQEKEYNALQRQLISMASHEFRTPLAIIDGAVQALLRRMDRMAAGEITERLERIRNAVSRTNDVINSTLEIASIDSKEIELSLRPCDAGAIILRCCRSQIEAMPSAVAEVDLDDCPLSLNADPGLLERIFTNLISNAIRFSKDTPNINITGAIRDGEVWIKITDHGVGIPADEMPKVFDRFFRASTASGIPGTGTGLYLVREWVQMHGGSVSVESVQDQGSTFTVRLPVDAAAKKSGGGRAPFEPPYRAAGPADLAERKSA